MEIDHVVWLCHPFPFPTPQSCPVGKGNPDVPGHALDGPVEFVHPPLDPGHDVDAAPEYVVVVNDSPSDPMEDGAMRTFPKASTMATG